MPELLALKFETATSRCLEAFEELALEKEAEWEGKEELRAKNEDMLWNGV